MCILRPSVVVILLLCLTCIDAGGSCQENVYLEVGRQGVVSCHFEDYDIIGWIHGTGDVTGTSPFIHKEGSQIYGRGYESGDYDMHPNGSLIINEVKLTNEFNYTVLFVPSGGANEYFKVPVKVYVPPEPGYPVVNGRAIEVVIHGNTTGLINCSMTGIRPSVHLEWVASSDEISLNSEHRVTDNSDGTYNTYLNSSYNMVNSPTWRVSLICRVAGQMADLFPSVTTVYLLLEQPESMLPVPVIDGCYSQPEVCTLMMTTEETITCSVKGVPHHSDLNLDLYTLPDLRCVSLITDRINTHPSGYYDIITSCRYIVDETFIDTMVHCFLSGTDRNIQPVNSTVKAKVMWQDQDCEDRIGWPQTVNTVILVFLTIEINLLLFPRLKLCKDYVRKFYINCTNPRKKKKDLEEDGTVDNQYFQELSPLQPVNNKDNIEAGCSQCSYCREMRTNLLKLLTHHESYADSGMSSCPSSSTVSGDTRELEGRNTQDTVDVLC